MITFEVSNLAARLPEFIARLKAGEAVALTDHEQPLAEVKPAFLSARRRVLGHARGKITVPDDFDAPLPAEIENSFYSE